MDPEYDNTLNVSSTSGLLDSTMNTLSPIMNRDDYYPRKTHKDVTAIPDTYSTLYNTLYNGMKSYDSVSDNLTLAEIASTGKSLMIGYSDDIKTLEAGVSASAGELQQIVLGDAHTITLRFKGAYNAGDISRIIYTLVQEKADGSTTQWEAVTLDKADGTTSMFDSTGSGGRYDGVEGKISLRLTLGDADVKESMNVKEKGKYYITLTMQKYDQDTKSYVTLETHSKKFNNTTGF